MPKARAPGGLSKESVALWHRVTKRYELEPHGMELLQVALESLDMYRAARAVVLREGFVLTQPSEQKKLHPACVVMKQSRDGFVRAWNSIGIDLAPELEGDEEWQG